MSGPADRSYDDSFRETADNDQGTVQTRTAGTESADEPRAEPMSREEYAEYMRQGPAAGTGRDTGDENGRESTSESLDGHDPGGSDLTGEAQGMTREEYADYMRLGPAAGADDYGAGDDPGLGGGEQAANTGYESRGADPAGKAQGMTRSEYAEYMRQGPAAGDGDPGHADAGISADRAATPARYQERAGNRAEKIIFDGKELEVTRNAADGIWVEGLAGEPPTRIGDVLSSPEDGERSRIENLREELNKDAEDIIDMGGQWTDLLRDAFGTPPPTHTMTHHRSPEMAGSRPEHGINAGHGVEAALTLAIAGTAAAHKLHEWWQGRRQDRREADHAGN